ncbi:hypothetical protein I4641_05770 [Waterburya agarophytonicola K14]|uniref:Outer membrane protein beta-barrel domain-containing protein n=1 Tax=Waterburya agarophytonicola KI4 TaxID=2874699 RepID=A0A964FEC5_9CYAN|nr:hypothetical protein [Waterburya agarophytonicola]MCC0176485.1 hypothetical protein [Waterburya agarophytonicola KI4]
MRTLTFACSTLLFLPLLCSTTLASPVAQSTSEMSETSEVEINQQTHNESTVTADNTGWSDSNYNELKDIKLQLQNIRQRNFTPSRGVPSLTIANPYGFGADRGFYSGLSYQVDTRGGLDGENDGDATFGFGKGFGNAQKSIGAELSYSLVSFGQNGRDFGSGGFNLKLHRKIARGWGVSAGWNSFLSIGDANDLEDSLYLSTTKIISLKEKVSAPFSRVGVTAGIGNGQFRTEDDIANDNSNFNIFGSLAFRVARPVSFITEWTGQDLAMGLSVSPVRTLPLTINLGARDLAGAGDGVRFVFGVGTGF